MLLSKNISIESYDVGKGIRVRSLDMFEKKHTRSDIVEILDSVCRKSLTSKINPQYILEDILLKILQLFDCDVGNITVNSNTANSQICVCMTERTPGSFIGLNSQTPKHNTGIFGEVLTRRVIVISNDIEKDPRCLTSKEKHSYVIPSSHPRIRKWLGFPLCDDVKTLGVLSIARCSEISPDFVVENVIDISPLLGVCCSLLSVRDQVPQFQNVKDRFLATISHEIRTPLNGILGMITLLPEAGPLNEKQGKYLINLTECAVELTSLLNNILDFSKMSSDKLQLSKTHVDLQKTLENSIRLFEGQIQSKNIRLCVHNKISSAYLIGDAQRIMQILTNLIGNAVKFTKDQIDIYIHLERVNIDNITKYKFLFTVKDNGVGIPYDEQSKIFEVFHQSSSLSTYMSRSGTGLGLSIVRELVRLMRGKIVVESPGIGKGSAFTFYVLLDGGIDPKEVSKKYSKKFKNTKVLVITNDVNTRITISNTLFSWSCTPIVASSIEEATSTLKYTYPKIAIVDTEVTSVEFIQFLRSKKIYTIGLQNSDKQSKYFNRCIHTPINEYDLLDSIVRCKRQSRKPRKSQLKILICEDNPKNAYTLKELLLSLNYKQCNIDIVENGKECIDTIKTKKYHVILMDIIMPVMSGLEAAKYMQNINNKPFIIAISAAIQPSDKINCQDAGIYGWVDKPIDREKLKYALLPLTKNIKHKGR